MLGFIALCAMLSSCVLPPPEVDSRVLPAEEVSVVALLNRGEQYSQSGRTDLAEVEFRKALELQPDLPNLLNNLGFALLEQNRLLEASTYFQAAIRIDAKSKVAYENLIRVYYRLGDFDKAIDGYRVLLKQLPPKLVIEDATDEVVPELSVFDLVRVYRDLATAYYAIGLPDEAVCYSAKAVQVLGVPAQLLLHARMLLSLNKPEAAVPVLRQLLAGVGDTWSAALIDYGVALYLTGDNSLAQQAVDRVIAKSALSPSRQLAASVVKLLILRRITPPALADAESNVAESVDGQTEVADAARRALVQNSVLENIPEFCENVYTELPDYWPELVMGQVDELYEQVCNERNEDAF